MIQMHLGGDLSAAFPPCYPIQAVSSFSIYFVEDPDCLFGCSKTLRWTPSPARARQSRARWPQCVEFIVNIRQASSTFSMAIVHVWPPRKCFHAHWNKTGFDMVWRIPNCEHGDLPWRHRKKEVILSPGFSRNLEEVTSEHSSSTLTEELQKLHKMIINMLPKKTEARFVSWRVQSII